MVRSHYDNLQVARNASDEVIKGAYKYLSQKWHPDKQPPDRRPEAERIMKLVNEAYEVLSDPAKRRLHDEWLAAEEAKERPEPESTAKNTSDRNTHGSGSSPSGLSTEAREEYAKAIASGIWPFALIGAFISVSILFGLLSQIGVVGKFANEHPFVVLAGVALYTGFGGKSIVDEKKKKLLSTHDDETLKLLHDRSTRRKTTLAICAAILFGAGVIGFAVFRAHPDLVGKSTDSSGSGDASTTPAPSAPTPAPPSAQPPSAHTEELDQPGSNKPFVVANECGSPVAVYLAYRNPNSGKWDINFWKFNGNERSSLDRRFPVSGVYFFARTTDNSGYHWGPKEDDDTATVLSIDGDGPAERFQKVPESASSQYLLTLTCSS